jgi:polyisoprenoid-binding protein YceI
MQIVSNTRRSFLELAMIGLILVVPSACTALRVVTHSTSIDPASAPAGNYHLDPHHWSVVFDVDHLSYTRFVMRFDRVSGQLAFTPQSPEMSRVTAVIDAASIDTNDQELDQMITGADMLETDRYPDIRFVSTDIRRTGDNTGEMTGDLTLHGRSRPLVLQVTYNGGAPNPLTRAPTLGFTATGSFDRSRFGLGTWFPAVGNQVNVSIQAEFVKDD